MGRDAASASARAVPRQLLRKTDRHPSRRLWLPLDGFDDRGMRHEPQHPATHQRDAEILVGVPLLRLPKLREERSRGGGTVGARRPPSEVGERLWWHRWWRLPPSPRQFPTR